MTRPSIEPSSDMRQLANAVRQFHVALTEQGFSRAEALVLTGQWITAMIQNSQPGDQS